MYIRTDSKRRGRHEGKESSHLEQSHAQNNQ